MKMLEKTVLFYILKIDQEKDVESEVSGLEQFGVRSKEFGAKYLKAPVNKNRF